jgi:hypothetical protein
MAKAKAGAQDLDRAFASSARTPSGRSRPDVVDQGDRRRRLGNGGAGAAVGARAVGLAAGATTATVAVNGLGTARRSRRASCWC